MLVDNEKRGTFSLSDAEETLKIGITEVRSPRLCAVINAVDQCSISTKIIGSVTLIICVLITQIF